MSEECDQPLHAARERIACLEEEMRVQAIIRQREADNTRATLDMMDGLVRERNEAWAEIYDLREQLRTSKRLYDIAESRIKPWPDTTSMARIAELETELAEAKQRIAEMEISHGPINISCGMDMEQFKAAVLQTVTRAIRDV